MVAGAGEEKLRVALRTGVLPRIDIGAAYSGQSDRFALTANWLAVLQSQKSPVSILAGYGNTAVQHEGGRGSYVFASRAEESCSLMAGVLFLDDLMPIGVVSGSVRIAGGWTFAALLHGPEVPLGGGGMMGMDHGDGSELNVGVIRSFGNVNIGLWLNGAEEGGTPALSFSTMFRPKT